MFIVSSIKFSLFYLLLCIAYLLFNQINVIISNDMVISFCGHRDFTPDAEKEKTIIDILLKYAETEQEVICYTGGYGAFDWFATSCIRKAQAIAKNIRNCLIIPYITTSHLDRISLHTKEFDEIIYPPLENIPPKFAIIRRNEWMIDNCDLLIAYVKYSWGGAARTLGYARRKEVRILLV